MTASAPLSDRLLRDARELARRGEWQALVRLGDVVEQAEVAERPELAYLLSDAHHRIGRIAHALRLALELEERGDLQPPLRMRLVNLTGMCHFLMGEIDAAEDRFGSLMDVATRAGEAEFVARAANNLGVIANVRGRREQALTYYQRALAAYQELGHLRGLAQTRHNLGISCRDLGFADEADRHFCRAIDLAREAGSRDVAAYAAAERALLRVHAGDSDYAEGLAQLALGELERLGDPQKRAEGLRVLAVARAARGNTDGALELLEEAIEVALQSSNALLRGEIQRERGRLLVGRDPAAARAALSDALAQFEALHAAAEIDAVQELIARL